jgi:transcriptional regulator with XRE-family HTH domain
MGRADDDFDDTRFLKLLGEHIGKIRTARGYSQDRLTDEAGLARGTLSKIERAQVSVKAVTLARLASTLGVPLRKLTDFEF